jgi:two-component system, LytTR family, response regulator
MIRCIITDDEPLAREGLADYVSEIDFLQLAGVCSNPVELMKMMNEQVADLLFLDLQMPKMNGFEFLKVAKQPPLVVITTAYPQYAVQGFEYNVLDYLVKPITFDRFYTAALRAKDQQMLITSGVEQVKVPDEYVFIKSGQIYEKIMLDDILFISALENYITIVTKQSKHMSLMPLKTMEEYLRNKPFVRVHKSYLVAVTKIDAIDGNEIRIGAHRLPISRNFREQVMQIVMEKRVLR